jgi:outer membrane protein TolC
MLRFILSILVSLFLVKNGHTQSLSDSSKTLLPLTEFLNLVKQNHPIAKQSALLTRTAQAELLAAKGGFDPKLYGDYEQKFFDSKNYFAFGEYGVKVPTWYGIEVKGGYNTATGNFIDPENKLPKQGQAIVGISLPLLQNLMMDERRANLFKAQQAQGLFQAEKDNLTNDLAFEATQTYWKWAFYHQQKTIFDRAVRVAQERFNAIKTSFELGDRMAMDTLESFTQVQDRTVEFNRVQLEVQEANLKLANFLWGKNAQPMAYVAQWQPQILEVAPDYFVPRNDNSATEKDIFLKNLVENHPILRGYDVKLNQLEIDRKLKREKLKPKLNLNYNFLGNGFNWSNLFTNNYKWGIGFSTSTLFRSERGDVQLANIKIENTRLWRDQKALELKNKLQQFFNETDNLQAQIQLYKATVNNYQQLLQLENTRFELGESSFFLINSRENKYIEAQLKLAKLVSEYQIARAATDWASGRLGF